MVAAMQALWPSMKQLELTMCGIILPVVLQYIFVQEFCFVYKWKFHLGKHPKILSFHINLKLILKE